MGVIPWWRAYRSCNWGFLRGLHAAQYALLTPHACRPSQLDPVVLDVDGSWGCAALPQTACCGVGAPAVRIDAGWFGAWGTCWDMPPSPRPSVSNVERGSRPLPAIARVAFRCPGLGYAPCSRAVSRGVGARRSEGRVYRGVDQSSWKVSSNPSGRSRVRQGGVLPRGGRPGSRKVCVAPLTAQRAGWFTDRWGALREVRGD